MPPKRKMEAEEARVKKPRVDDPPYGVDLKWFFKEYPEAKYTKPSIEIICNPDPYMDTSKFFVNVEIVEKNSSVLKRMEKIDDDGINAIDLRGDADICATGIHDFVEWSERRQIPNFTTRSGPGDIFDHVISSYITAQRLRAGLLCDLILCTICRIGRQHRLVIFEDQIDLVYERTREADPLRLFLAALVAFLVENRLPNPYFGDASRSDEQISAYDNSHRRFKYLLQEESFRAESHRNPCETPLRFVANVLYHKENKERLERRAEQEFHGQDRYEFAEQGGSRDSPVFIE